jgi:hypothetical protein
MKCLVIFSLLIFSYASFAATHFPIKEKNFEIRGADALQHLEQLLLSPSEVLNIFEPEGGEISNRQVTGNQITFTATKKVAFISKSVFVKGTLDSEFSDEICHDGEIGFKATFDLAGSDDLVFDSIDGLIAEVCLKEMNKSFVKGRVSGRLIKGHNYSRMLGGSIREVIAEQVPAFIRALEMGVKKRR